MRLDKVSERIYANCDGETGGNVGIVIMDEAVAAVDSQFPVSGEDFRNSITKVTEKPVTHLLLTHIHGDHIFGSQAFEDCEIVSHSRLKNKMEENLRIVWAPGNLKKMLAEVAKSRPERVHLYEGLRIVLPNMTFEDIFTLDNIDMIHLGGHTDCSSIVYVPEDRVLFAGDILFAKTFPWAGDATANPETWIEAYESILSMEIDTIIPGHGPICGMKEVETQLSWFKAVRKEMKKLISEGVSEEKAIKHDKYPKFYPSEGERRNDSLRHWYRFWLKGNDD